MGFRIALRVLVVVFAAAPSAVNAVIMHSPGQGAPAADYIAYGTQSKFQATGWLTAFDPPSGLTALGSGTLIDPHWMVTAAHVVKNRGPLQVGFGTNLLTSPGTKYSVAQAFVHPTWNGTTPSGFSGIKNADLALLYFEDPIVGITPAPLYNGVLSATVPNPDQVHQIGYGRPGYHGSLSAYDGQKRGAINRVYETTRGNAGEYLQTYLFDTSRPNHYEYLGGAASPGDSGGSVYIDVGGNMQLAAVISYGVSGITDMTGALQLRHYEGWIADTMASVPEPVGVVFVLGVFAVCRRTRRAA